MNALCLYDISKLFGMNSKKFVVAQEAPFIANDVIFSKIENIKSKK